MAASLLSAPHYTRTKVFGHSLLQLQRLKPHPNTLGSFNTLALESFALESFAQG